MSAFSIALRYSDCMTLRQTLPLLWLLSDARNDAGLDDALRDLPDGSGLVFRHYHLQDDARRARFDELSSLARAHGHWVILSGRAELATDWGADGVYGDPQSMDGAEGLKILATAHNAGELQCACRVGVDGVFLSPVFPTRSHPEGTVLGAHGFSELASQSSVPVIALGGMTHERARLLDWPRWGAIDGLVSTKSA